MTDVNEYQNADSKPFFEGAKEGRLLFQKCDRCGNVQFPPRRNCSACWHEGFSWIESTGKGRLESLTVVHRAPTAELRDRTPYVVAAVQVDEGVRMITNLLGDGALEASIGDAVIVDFVPDARGNVLPQFRLAR